MPGRLLPPPPYKFCKDVIPWDLMLETCVRISFQDGYDARSGRCGALQEMSICVLAASGWVRRETCGMISYY